MGGNVKEASKERGRSRSHSWTLGLRYWWDVQVSRWWGQALFWTSRMSPKTWGKIKKPYNSTSEWELYPWGGTGPGGKGGARRTCVWNVHGKNGRSAQHLVTLSVGLILLSLQRRKQAQRGAKISSRTQLGSGNERAVWPQHLQGIFPLSNVEHSW